MACPYFRPIQPASPPTYSAIRLPLIKEFDGHCTAGEEPSPVPAHARFKWCNHGYSRGECEHLPATEGRSCFRYTVAAQTRDHLEVLWVEEKDYTPVRWDTVHYQIATGTVREDLSACMRAQIEAFSRSYLDES